MFYIDNGKTDIRKKPIQRRSKDIVDSILQATKALLVTSNYQEINTNIIAERAGVSIGSLYQYFKTKASIVTVLFESKLEKHIMLICECAEINKNKSIDEYLSSVLNTTFDIFIEDREHIRKYVLSEILMLRYKSIMGSRTIVAKKIASDLYHHYPHYREEIFIRDVERSIHALMVIVHSVIWNEQNLIDRETFVKNGILLIKSYIN